MMQCKRWLNEKEDVECYCKRWTPTINYFKPGFLLEAVMNSGMPAIYFSDKNKIIPSIPNFVDKSTQISASIIETIENLHQDSQNSAKNSNKNYLQHVLTTWLLKGSLRPDIKELLQSYSNSKNKTRPDRLPILDNLNEAAEILRPIIASISESGDGKQKSNTLVPSIAVRMCTALKEFKKNKNINEVLRVLLGTIVVVSVAWKYLAIGSNK